MHREALRRAIKIIGGQAALANQLGIRRQVVNRWLNRDKQIPYQYAILIEQITKGKVSRFRLAPYVKADQYNTEDSLVDHIMSYLLFMHNDLSARLNSNQGSMVNASDFSKKLLDNLSIT